MPERSIDKSFGVKENSGVPKRKDKAAFQAFVAHKDLQRFNSACGLAGRERNDVITELIVKYADSLGIPQIGPPPVPPPAKRARKGK